MNSAAPNPLPRLLSRKRAKGVDWDAPANPNLRHGLCTMKKMFIGGICVLALMACEEQEQPLAATHLKCGDFDIAVKVFDERIDTVVNGEAISMPQVAAASGAKYQTENAAMGLWSKGEDWTMTVVATGQETIIKCAKAP